MEFRLVLSSEGRHRETLGQYDRHSTIRDPPLRSTGGPRSKSELVAWSVEPFARHPQTVNLYAPLTLPVGQARGKHCPQVWSGGRLAGPRCRTGLPYAFV